MSGKSGFPGSDEEVASSTALTSGPTAQPQVSGSKHQQVPKNKDTEEEKMESKEEESDNLEHREEVPGSAVLEPSTLPWPGDKERRLETENGGASSEKGVAEESDAERSGGTQDTSEDRSQAESDRKRKAKWRESMPEGDRWRDDDAELQRGNKGDGSLADDEDEDEEEEEGSVNWMPEKAALVFTPQVNIVCPSSKEMPQENQHYIEKIPEKELQAEPVSPLQLYPEWKEEDDSCTYLCEGVCSEKLKLGLGVAAAAVFFPFLVWGGYALLPFDAPQLKSAPLRLVYTLRCSFFAIVPIVLGVVVQGVARLRYGSLSPLYEGKLQNKEVAVHWHYINDSLALFLFYFLQLAVMATYINQDLLKLVPLLTIVFAFGRLIYWVCLSLGSSVRGLGFGLSFLPILVMLGTNLYYICSSLGQGAVFDVGPSTTDPPPMQRWWG
ncbi:transmembrane protein 79 [Polymixia lowei]